MKSMDVLLSNVDNNVHASYNILPKDHSYIDFLAPCRKSAFSPYTSAKQAAGTTVPKDSPTKTKSRCCCPIADEEDDDDYEAYMLRMEREADHQKESLANYKQVIGPDQSSMEMMPASSSKRIYWSRDEDNKDDYDQLVAKEMKKLKRKKQEEIRKDLDSKPPITNEITERLKEFITSHAAINGTDLTLVIQKLLFTSDLSRGHNRLTMPINQLKTLEFLTPDEKEKLDNKSGFDVQLVGPELEIYKKPMNLVKWNMQTTQNYVFKTHWSELVADHVEDLVENSIIQVWSFCKHNKLCFALAKVGRAMIFDNQDDSPLSSS